MSQLCGFCINQESCSDCKAKGWMDKFIPREDVRKYFKNGYNGVRGYDGKHTWDFDTRNPDLKSTHSVVIDNKFYCPYCGNIMFSIQGRIIEYNDYSVTGHFCICNGAQEELQYEKEKSELQKKHKKELYDLNNRYKEALRFDSEKLFNIKQYFEKKNFEFSHYNHTHFTKKDEDNITILEEII